MNVVTYAPWCDRWCRLCRDLRSTYSIRLIDDGAAGTEGPETSWDAGAQCCFSSLTPRPSSAAGLNLGHEVWVTVTSEREAVMSCTSVNEFEAGSQRILPGEKIWCVSFGGGGLQHFINFFPVNKQRPELFDEMPFSKIDWIYLSGGGVITYVGRLSTPPSNNYNHNDPLFFCFSVSCCFSRIFWRTPKFETCSHQHEGLFGHLYDGT